MAKINIISGFLGAGKTTLIKKLLSGKVRNEKIILLENEYGDVGVDGAFMKDTGIIVDELNSGCICCTLVGDFQKAVDDLIEKYHPDRLIIEPSGVGKLSEILTAVEKAKDRHPELTIGGCATVVDAGKCRIHMKNFGEFFLDQVKTASTVIFSRTQLLSADRVEKSRALIEEQHPGVRVITTPWDDLDADTMLEVIESGRPIELHVEHEHHHHDEECHCHDHEHEHHHDHDEECHCHDHEHEHHHDHDEECHCHDHEHEHHHDHDEGCHCHDHEHEHHHDHDEECHCHDHEHEHHHHEHDGHCTCGCHDHDHEHGHHHHHADEIFLSVGWETAKRYEQADIEGMLSKLSDEEEYGQVLCAKGILQNTAGEWFQFDYVPGESQFRPGSADYTGRICVIGAHIDEKALKELFNA
ncbi:MAG: GTP-binding protein [Clostridia bacterium]|nr:GTP-binding protein [Clostridia bacterium]